VGVWGEYGCMGVCGCALHVLFVNIGQIRNMSCLEYSCFVIQFTVITVFSITLRVHHDALHFTD